MSFTSWYNRSLNKIWGFVEDRTGMRKWALRPQPEFTFKPSYWTGAFVAIAFLYQVVSGMLLLLYYQPSVAVTSTACGLGTNLAPAAWCSTYYIINSVPMGSLLLSTHLYGAYAMIFLLFVHFFRGYYLGVYKKPREFSWMVGSLLMFVTLGMGFTGYLLPYTALSYQATFVGINLTTSLTIPLPGGIVINAGQLIGPFLLADGTAQGLLSRMFVAHVLLIPLALGALLYAHIGLFESHGIAPPATSDPLQRRRFTAKEDEKHVPFMPHILFYMAKWGLLYVGVLLAIAALWPWQLLTWYGPGQPVPTFIIPDWYFLWLFKVLDFQGITPVIAVTFATVIALYVLFVPFLDRSHRTHPRDRPVFVYIGTCLLQLFIILSVWGQETPSQQILPAQIAWTLGPMFAVNAVVITALHLRYRANYRRRLDRQKATYLGVYSTSDPAPIASRSPGVTASEVSSSE
ncbi:MAG: cytochrome b [Thermoplasmata archaeon]